MTPLHTAARIALDALIYHRDQTRPIDRTDAAITALREALAQPAPEPIGEVLISTDPLGREGVQVVKWADNAPATKVGMKLYAAPPAAPAPAVPNDAALNALARLFHNGEEIESDDGAAMAVDLSLWHEASEAFESLIGDGDSETLASSAAPVVREPLTEDRIAELWVDILSDTPASGIHETDGLQWVRLARAIERAHGIGGGNG